MLRLAKKIFSTGIQTEILPMPQHEIEHLGRALQVEIANKFSRALAIRMVDAGSCNACELEIHAVNNPYYNLERYGIHFVASPRHADLLLVTGPVTKNMQEALLRTYDATPDPKLVVAVGDCAKCGGVFQGSYAFVGPVNEVIPVNVVVSGCPPTPVAIMQGIFAALQCVS